VIAVLWILWFFTVLTTLSYLPSHLWLEAIRPFYMLIGAAAVAITAFILLLSFQVGQLQKAQQQNESFILWGPIFIVFAAYVPTAALLRHGLPAMIAVGWGEQVEHSFFVLEPDKPHGVRGRCDREIVLRDMPLLTALCNLPPEFHDRLRPGTDVIFIGRGTWMGLFVEDFREP
jgi:hypothetical protein